MTKNGIVFLEYNEINFDFLMHYVRQGALPNFASFLDRHGHCETFSEQEYEHLEPWIQWVTAHTGKTYAEHGIFRLGDVNGHDIPQIWERLEQEKGLRVGAISPMNAANRLKDASFFVPDPWTETKTTGSKLLQRLSAAVSQAVNDNAKSRLTVGSAISLIAGLTVYARPKHYLEYIKLALNSRRRPWSKALFLDRLLADIFTRLYSRSRPDFSTLFLNAGAHIQHHYMFDSAAYQGSCANPEWYAPEGADPILDVYTLYDRILGDVLRAAPDARIMMATGLHQDPHETLTYYWRLKDHADFLDKIGVSYTSVAPRMSRDFLVSFDGKDSARRAETILKSALSEAGEPLFSVDNRGRDLFAMLVYPQDIPKGSAIKVGNQTFEDFDKDVAFVAIKNGEHNGIGYFADSGLSKDSLPEAFPLADIPARITAHFDA